MNKCLKNHKFKIVLNLYKNSNCHRHFSYQTTIETVVRTQTGIFKTLSESTPVEYVQKLLLNVHDITGLPWWATIVCTTALLRTSVLPLAIYQNYIIAKLENLRLEMPNIVKELKQETAIAIKMYNWDEKTARIIYNRSVRQQWDKLIVRENCHPFKAALLPWIQIPIWISLSVGLRNLVYMLPSPDLKAHFTYTEMTVEGFGWVPNLTVIDSSLILPVTLCLINLTIIEVQALAKVKVPSKHQRYLTNFFRGFSVLLVPISASVPSCLVLYWVTSSTYGLIQNLLLMSPRIKRFFRIPQTPSELEQPYQNLLTGFKHKFKYFEISK